MCCREVGKAGRPSTVTRSMNHSAQLLLAVLLVLLGCSEGSLGGFRGGYRPRPPPPRARSATMSSPLTQTFFSGHVTGNAGELASNWTKLGTVINESSTGGALEITLAAGFDTGDYKAEIDIPKGANVTILGQGHVLDAAEKGGRFFSVFNGASLALDSMTLQNGSAGAILNAGTLCMNSTTFETNSAMGNQRFGGAICNNKGATCTVRNSHFLSNKAVVGGAIHNRGDLHINSAIFDHNQAKDQGGAIHNDGGGWGRGDLHIDNATFENNGAAWGGAINNRGTCNINSTAFLSNPTNYYNGGGSDFAWGFGPTCGPPFVRENAAFVFVSQPLGTNAYWNQKQTDRL